MRKIFIVLSIAIFIITFVLYSRATLHWTFIPEILVGHLISISRSSKNDSTLLNETGISNQIKKSSLPPSENRRFAMFSCSIHATPLAYTFYPPLVAASWKRIGYEAIAVFVGDFTKPNVLTARLNLSRNYLKHLGAHIVDLQCNESYSIKLSQLVRVFSGFLTNDIVQDEDNLLTSDSDLIPLKASEYRPTPGTHGFIFNAFCCGSFKRRGRSYRMFPSKFSADVSHKYSILFNTVSLKALLPQKVNFFHKNRF